MDPNPATNNSLGSSTPTGTPDSNQPPKINYSVPSSSAVPNTAIPQTVPSFASPSNPMPPSPPPFTPGPPSTPPRFSPPPPVGPLSQMPPSFSPPPEPPPISNPVIVSSQASGKFPLMAVMLILILIISGFSGSFLYFRFIGKNNRSGGSKIINEDMTQPQISRAKDNIELLKPSSEAGSLKPGDINYKNPFDTAEQENPFASESSYQNPFGEEESLSSYQNPFETTP